MTFLEAQKKLLFSNHKFFYYIIIVEILYIFEHIYSLHPKLPLTTINDPPNDVFLAHSILFNLIYVRKAGYVRIEIV